MVIARIDKNLAFPSANSANKDGLLAFGGDLEVERLILAYKNGIFPWNGEKDPILWWSPDPRCVLIPNEYILATSLKRFIKKQKFYIKLDSVFERVLLNCAKKPRIGQKGTWITDSMMSAYKGLFEIGYAHSFEVYIADELAGGLYGVYINNIFFAESMYFSVSPASAVALYSLACFANSQQIKAIDCQFLTEYLNKIGAKNISRDSFLETIANSSKSDLKGSWFKYSQKLTDICFSV